MPLAIPNGLSTFTLNNPIFALTHSYEINT